MNKYDDDIDDMVKTKFNCQNSETKSSDKYNSRCDKQLIQIEDIVSSEYFYFYLWDRLVVKNICYMFTGNLDMTPIFLNLFFSFSPFLFALAFHSPFNNNCKRESNPYVFFY